MCKLVEILFVDVRYDAFVTEKVKLEGLIFFFFGKFKSGVSFEDDFDVSIKLSHPFLHEFLFWDEIFEVYSCSFIV